MSILKSAQKYIASDHLADMTEDKMAAVNQVEFENKKVQQSVFETFDTIL